MSDLTPLLRPKLLKSIRKDPSLRFLLTKGLLPDDVTSDEKITDFIDNILFRDRRTIAEVWIRYLRLHPAEDNDFSHKSKNGGEHAEGRKVEGRKQMKEVDD